MRYLAALIATAILVTGCATTGSTGNASGTYLYKKPNGDNVWLAKPTNREGYELLSPVEYLYQADKSTDRGLKVTYRELKNGTREVELSFIPDRVIVLPQIEAWSKGAVYEADGIRWEAQGDKGTLIEKGKKRGFHQVKLGCSTLQNLPMVAERKEPIYFCMTRL